MSPTASRPIPVRLMVVDDEPEIRGMIADGLGRDGYTISHCGDGRELDAALSAGPADLILMDVILPGEDGLAIARRLRASSPVPIIMLTGKDTIIDLIVGLEVGADDYLTKPFDMRELRARIRAVLRRAATRARHLPQPTPEGLVCFGAVFLDREAHCLRDGDGAVIRLTAGEFSMLDMFARNPNVVLSRDRLYEPAPGVGTESLDRCVDIRIARLRKKIEADASKPGIIRTVRNAGYIFVPPRDCA